MKETNPMMTFEAVSETIAVATNSLKKVVIVRSINPFDYDRNFWMVYTPEGRLDDNKDSAGPFTSWEQAKREAECEVGMAMGWN
jgi:hypothetical protein